MAQPQPTVLIPHAFWFRWEFPCRRIEGAPRKTGALLDLPETCRLPDTPTLTGTPGWAELRVGWNDGGLALAVTARRKPVIHADASFQSSGVHVWVDTRDTRDIHRATRYCHRFAASLTAAGSGTALTATVRPVPIPRASASPQTVDPATIPIQAAKTREGWRLELFLPATALNGFDPEVNRRLGFAYEVVDPAGSSQYLGVGREFPVIDDPSLWASLSLVD